MSLTRQKLSWAGFYCCCGSAQCPPASRSSGLTLYSVLREGGFAGRFLPCFCQPGVGVWLLLCHLSLTSDLGRLSMSQGGRPGVFGPWVVPSPSLRVGLFFSLLQWSSPVPCCPSPGGLRLLFPWGEGSSQGSMHSVQPPLFSRPAPQEGHPVSLPPRPSS